MSTEIDIIMCDQPREKGAPGLGDSTFSSQFIYNIKGDMSTFMKKS